MGARAIQLMHTKAFTFSEATVCRHRSRTYYRCFAGFVIVNSDEKLILFVLYHVVTTTVLISNVVVDIIKASSVHYLQGGPR
ncbi:hypothetical protein BK662_12430 [Pseudomonas frederiksbergensis]|uniref:Uncharacterized protein n=1 Tax=Pseudomonas frederiksbergensis TaxID=104087 RepID=A0A423HRP9_9PSED|nr:hypothetical protein BK662_12430 [Pseudomonas frederiksbergensis]